MKLQYNVLWFEDNQGVINQLAPKIKDHLNDLGFEFNFESYGDGEALASRVRRRDYDLILTDLNLNDGALGDAIVEQLREDEILTEVLLYSSDATAIQQAQQRNQMIERVSWGYGSGNNLLERITRLISLTVRKVQDLNNMRGLVIAEAISLETQVKEILLEYFGAVSGSELDTGKDAVMKRIYENRVDSAKRVVKRLESDFNYKMLVALIEDDALFTANNVIESFQSILNDQIKDLNRTLNVSKDQQEKNEMERRVEIVKNLREDLSLFQKEVIDIRNTLAHVKEEILDDGTSVLQSRKKGSEPIPIAEKTYIDMRKNLAKHKLNLATIALHLS